jgi:cell division protein FtsN
MFRRSLFRRSLSDRGSSSPSGLAVLVTPIVGLLVALAGCNKDAPTPSGESASAPEAPALANVAAAPTALQSAPQPGGESGAKPLVAKDPVEDAGEASDDSDDDAEDEEEAKPKKKKRTAKKGSRRRSRSKAVEDKGEAETSSKSEAKPAVEPEPGAPVLSLKRIQLAEAVKDREPVDPEETFSMGSTSKLYAFLELSNASSEEEKVTVTFVPPIGGATKVTLDVGPQKRWRTWALRKSLSAPGTWRVVVRDSSGRELGSRSFEVTE